MKTKKMKLAKETLRVLGEKVLGRVVGGVSLGPQFCQQASVAQSCGCGGD